MSEYTPITGELRERIEQAEHIVPLSGDSKYTQVRINLAWLTEKLDAIDSVHAQLERENESLKAELDRVLGEQENRDGWVELPRDADGVPIRVGDTVECVDDTLAPRNVTSINLAGDGWWVYINGLGRWPDKYRHVTPDTWESIIYDAMQAGRTDITVDVTPLIQRCKALCERTKEDE
jgi:hypothetical protein